MTGVRLGKVPCVPIEEEYVSAERWVILLIVILQGNTTDFWLPISFTDFSQHSTIFNFNRNENKEG